MKEGIAIKTNIIAGIIVQIISNKLECVNTFTVLTVSLLKSNTILLKSQRTETPTKIRKIII